MRRDRSERLERRRERAPHHFVGGVITTLAGVALGIAAMSVSPAFQHGAGRGEPVPEVHVTYPTPPLERDLLIGAGALSGVGLTLMFVGAYQMSEEGRRPDLRPVPIQVEAQA